MMRIPTTPRHVLTACTLAILMLAIPSAAEAQGIPIPAPKPTSTTPPPASSLPEQVSAELQAAKFDVALALVEREAAARQASGAPDWAIREADHLATELAKLRDFDADARRQVAEAETLAARARDAFRARDLGLALAAGEGSDAHFETLWAGTTRHGRLLLLRARVLAASGRWEEALPFATRARELLDPAVGPLAPASIRQRATAGQCHHQLGALREAEDHLRQAFESARDHHGDDPRFALSFALPYAAFSLATDRWSRASSIAAATLETAREAYGEDDELTVGAHALLGAALRGQGRGHEAEPHLVAVYETRRLRLGPQHAATMAAGLELTALWIDRMRWERATPIAEQLVRTATATPELQSLLPTLLRRLAAAQAGSGKTVERDAAIAHLQRAERVAKEFGQLEEQVLAAWAIARLAENGDAYARARELSARLPEESPLRFALALASPERDLTPKIDHGGMLRFAREQFGASHPLALRAGIQLARAQLRARQLEIAATTVEGLVNDALAASAVTPPASEGVEEVATIPTLLREIRTVAMRMAVASSTNPSPRNLDLLHLRGQLTREPRSFAAARWNSPDTQDAIQAEEEHRFLHRTAKPDSRDEVHVELLARRARTWEALISELPGHLLDVRVDVAPNPTRIEIAYDGDQAILWVTANGIGPSRGWVLADGAAEVKAWRLRWSRLAAMTRGPTSDPDVLLAMHQSLVIPDGFDLEIDLEDHWHFLIDHRLELISFSQVASPARATMVPDPFYKTRSRSLAAPHAIVVGNPRSAADTEDSTPRLPSGVLVRRVEEGSNAYRAGLREGDLFQNYAGHTIANLDDLDTALQSVRAEVASGRIGSEARVELGYWRRGKSHRGSIALGRFGVRFDPSPPADVLHLLGLRSIDFDAAVTRARDSDFDPLPTYVPHVPTRLSLLQRSIGVPLTVLEGADLAKLRATHREVMASNTDGDHPRSTVWILEVPAVHPTAERPIGAVGIRNRDSRWLDSSARLEWTEQDLPPPRVVVLPSSRRSQSVARLDLAQSWTRHGSEVLAELWPSSPHARAFLLSRFLDALKGRTPDHALEIARGQLRIATVDEVASTLGLSETERRDSLPSAELNGAPFSHPYYWSGWVLVIGT